jgi:hypothetical protein
MFCYILNQSFVIEVKAVSNALEDCDIEDEVKIQAYMYI